MAYRYASSKGLDPYTDGYQVGQLLILDCATRAVQLNDQAMLTDIYQLGSYTSPVSPGEALASMQCCLRDMGFDPGPIDGIKGPRTEAALIRWVARRRLLSGDYTADQITALFMADCARTMAGTSPRPPQRRSSPCIAANRSHALGPAELCGLNGLHPEKPEIIDPCHRRQPARATPSTRPIP
jgi:peptidoglycan hydrolase-like protein with peptidoglycan-binding domain